MIFIYSSKEKQRFHIKTPSGTLCKMENGGSIKKLTIISDKPPENRKACSMCVDHIKPLKRHPELALDENNLQVLCNSCNVGKGSHDQTDWRSYERTSNPLHAHSPSNQSWVYNYQLQPEWCPHDATSGY